MGGLRCGMARILALVLLLAPIGQAMAGSPHYSPRAGGPPATSVPASSAGQWQPTMTAVSAHAVADQGDEVSSPARDIMLLMGMIVILGVISYWFVDAYFSSVGL